MSEEQQVKLEYPCSYPIKVMGLQQDDFVSCVLAIIQRHDPAFSQESATYRESRNGKYLAVNVVITATGAEQIQALFEELKASGKVSVVL